MNIKKVLSLVLVLTLLSVFMVAVSAQEPTPEPITGDEEPFVTPPTIDPVVGDDTPVVGEDTVVGVGEEEVAPTKEDAVVTVSDVGASAATTKSLSTNFTMVNLSSTDEANVTLEYLLSTGAAWTVGNDYAGPFTLDPSGQLQLRQYFDTAMPAGKGSVTISSDVPLGAIAQVQARGQTPSSGAYAGVTGGSNMVYVPMAAKNGVSASGVSNSQIIIQNTGDSNTTASISFVASNGTTIYQKTNISIASGLSYYYDLETESDSNIPDNWFGSATVQAASGGEVAVVSNFFLGKDMLQTFNGFPADSVGTKWANPSFFVRLSNKLSTVMTVQNVSGSSMPIGSIVANCTETESNTGSPTLQMSNNVVVGNFASYNFNAFMDTTLPANWSGACTIETPGDSVAFVQLRYIGAAYPLGAAFNALDANGTGTTVTVPLIAKRLSNKFATTVSIQNLSDTAPAHVTFKYVPSAESSSQTTVTVGPYTIPAGASLQHNHRLPGNGGTGSLVHNLPDGWTGGLTVTSSDQPIDGYVQLTYTDPSAPGGGDSYMAHNVFVQ